jgi:tRNA A-37 threonylcarbamoyl transferase component Bud32
MVREVFLVTRELPGVPLSDWVHDVTLDTALARAAAEDVGRAVAALHRAGIGFPELQAKHVFVAGESGDLRMGFLDLASAEVLPRIGRAARARDLGMLAATLPRRPVGRTLRLAALRAYREDADPRWPLSHAWEQTTRAAARLCRKRRYRKFLTTSAIPPAHEEHPAQGTRIVTEERDFLEHWGGLAGLDTEGPAGWTTSDRAAVFRADDDRVWRTWVTLTLLRRFDVDAPRPVALRRHGPSSRLLARVLPGPQVPGFEADLAPALLDLIARVLRAGLVPEPGFLAAIVQRPDGTLALPPGVPLSQPAKVRPTDFRRALTVLRRDARTLHWPTPFLRTWMEDMRVVARRSLDP